VVDQLTEREIPPQFVVSEPPNLQEAVSMMGKDLKKDLSQRGELTLDELINAVYDWENVYGEKLSEDEFECLCTLSLVLGTTSLVLQEHVGSRGKSEKAMFQSVITQQEIVKTVLGNLDENGKPDRGLAKSFCLVTEIFEEYFNPDEPKLSDLGVDTMAGYWQGIQGMVTASLLLRDAGWEVKLPPPELDIKHEVDLIAKNPEGEIFAIDITARVPKIIDDVGTKSQPFVVEKKPVPRHIPKEAIQNLQGMIRLNLPPLRYDVTGKYYEDRLMGYPNKDTVDEFKKRVSK
jgi:hypothetical protein